MKWMWAVSIGLWTALAAATLYPHTASSQRDEDWVEENPGTQLYAPTRQEWAVLYLKATKTLRGAGTRLGVSRMWTKGKDSESVRVTLIYGKDTSRATLDGLRRSAESAFDEFKQDMGWPWLKLEVVTQTGTPVLELEYP